MANDDIIITLIGTKLAKVGSEFVYKGPADDCDPCRIKNVCLNLRKGAKYRIVNLRPGVVHNCEIHDGGVKTVEVVETPIKANVEAVSYTHLRAHETRHDLVCRLLLEK